MNRRGCFRRFPGQRYFTRLLLAALALCAAPRSAWPSDRPHTRPFGQGVPIPAGQPQFFFDDLLVSENHNVKRRWHPLRKHPSNPIVDRASGEKHHLIFGSVIREPQPEFGGVPVFRMWYYTIRDDPAKLKHKHGATGVGYATSTDGIHWEKPPLGLYEFSGSLDNNVTYYPSTWDADCNPLDKTRLIEIAGVIRDPRSDAPTDERYKMIVGICHYECRNSECARIGSQCRRYVALVSPDGIRWQEAQRFVFPYPPCSVDCSCFVWDPYQQVYVLYNRAYGCSPAMRQRVLEKKLPVYDDGCARAVAYASSRDFRKWALRDPPVIVQVDETEPDCTHIYRMNAWPTGGQWFALWQHHNAWPQVGTIDIGVAHSRNGIDWVRVPWTEFLALENGDIGEWDRFNQAVASAPVRVGDDLWVYYSGRLERHGEARSAKVKDSGPPVYGIGLATIRLDGWCSLQAGFDRGELVTVPLLLPGGTLFLNAKSDWGEIIIEVLDQQGEVIDGMTSEPVCADGVRLPVRWSGRKTLATASKSAVRLRFRLTNALLYSWQVDKP